MPTFLTISATSPSCSYPIFLMRLGGPCFRPNPFIKIYNVELPGIESAFSELVLRNVDHLANKCVIILVIKNKKKKKQKQVSSVVHFDHIEFLEFLG